jgi:hypothetical protein
MRTIAVAILVVSFLAGCVRENPMTIKVRMEVGYPMLAGITGMERVWSVYRLQLAIPEGLKPGDSIIAPLRCTTGNCSVSRIDRNAGWRSADVRPALLGRIIQVSPDRHEAVLLFEPFPMEVSTEVFDQLRPRPGQTNLLDVEYIQTDQGLVFKAMRPAGIAARQAVRWK